MQPARHQEVARALGRARRQNRRVALHEALLDHAPADAGDDGAAAHHVGVHALAPEVEEAVAEPDLLAIVVLAVDRQRQGLGGVLHLKLGDADLDPAGRELGVHGLFVAGDHRAGQRRHGLRLERRHRVEQRLAGLRHALGDAVMVAQVHEDEMAVVAHPVDPAGEAHVPADIGRPERAAAVRSVSMHGGSPVERGVERGARTGPEQRMEAADLSSAAALPAAPPALNAGSRGPRRFPRPAACRG